MHTRSKRYVRRQRGRQRAAERRTRAKPVSPVRMEDRLAFKAAAGMKKRWPNALPFSTSFSPHHCRIRRQHPRTASKDDRKQSAAYLVVNKTGTQPCKSSSNSSGVGHAADSWQQWASRRSSNDRALRHPRPDQRGHLRRPRGGRLSDPLSWRRQRDLPDVRK